ncbi:MAG TPA: hypothetical protein DDY58_15320 [Terrisporobacter glycolicus]|uniref:restriction endonuclease subunit S n=1 Tax=Terrisporobacter TaxID=1505652 RepID=UPI000E8F66FD|nr:MULTISPECIES: restriction endonuclease subunit S [Terrisporobacter]HBI93668.1 hypothetical protein [Terrisporobacter hibernicus]
MKRNTEKEIGYKITEVGMIPIEWEVNKLSCYISELQNGTSINAGDRASKLDESGILKTSSITKQGFKPSENKVISQKEAMDFKVYPKKENLIIVRKNTPELVGMVNYVDRDYNNLFLPDLLWQTVFKHEDNINRKYIYYYLNTDYYNNIIKKLATGSSNSFPNIRKENFLNIKIAVPKKNEQDKIVAILENWDRVIELKEKLLEEKLNQKKGLMESLLTGKIRLKGFDYDWVKVKLDKLFDESKEKSIENNQYDILSVTKEGIYLQSEYFNRQIASKDNIGYKVVRKNNLVFSTMNLWMGSIDILKGYEVGIVSPACKVFYINEELVDISFMGYFVKSSYMMNLYSLNSEQGASVVRRNLDLKGLLSTSVKLPNINEQKIIGEIIDSSSKEIDLLKKEIELLKQQKKGLMQLLLTGIVRV